MAPLHPWQQLVLGQWPCHSRQDHTVMPASTCWQDVCGGGRVLDLHGHRVEAVWGALMMLLHNLREQSFVQVHLVTARTRCD
jgi:hypothetical protein